MKLMVDIKKAVQEYDLDTGVQKNFLVFNLGGVTHTVEASEEQLQQAIYDARVAGQNGHSVPAEQKISGNAFADRHTGPGPLTQHLASIEPEEEPEEEEPSIEDIGAQLLAEGHSEDEVLSILMQNFPEYFEEADEDEPKEAQFGGAAAEDGIAPSLFEDFSGQPTPEEMAEFMSEEDQMPDSIDVSSDDLSEGATLEAVITGPHGDPDDVVHRHPRTGQILSKAQYDRIVKHMKKPHIAAGQSDADKKAALRARAARIPRRSVPSDDAGNPIAPQMAPTPQPVQQQKPVPVMPGFEDDGFSQG